MELQIKDFLYKKVSKKIKIKIKIKNKNHIENINVW